MSNKSNTSNIITTIFPTAHFQHAEAFAASVGGQCHPVFTLGQLAPLHFVVDWSVDEFIAKAEARETSSYADLSARLRAAQERREIEAPRFDRLEKENAKLKAELEDSERLCAAYADIIRGGTIETKGRKTLDFSALSMKAWDHLVETIGQAEQARKSKITTDGRASDIDPNHAALVGNVYVDPVIFTDGTLNPGKITVRGATLKDCIAGGDNTVIDGDSIPPDKINIDRRVIDAVTRDDVLDMIRANNIAEDQRAAKIRDIEAAIIEGEELGLDRLIDHDDWNHLLKLRIELAGLKMEGR